jgi:hypothetical protein
MKTFKPIINDYDSMNRIIQNQSNQAKHRDALVKMIDLFKKKHAARCENLEEMSFVDDLCRRLNQKLNGSN